MRFIVFNSVVLLFWKCVHFAPNSWMWFHFACNVNGRTHWSHDDQPNVTALIHSSMEIHMKLSVMQFKKKIYIKIHHPRKKSIVNYASKQKLRLKVMRLNHASKSCPRIIIRAKNYANSILIGKHAVHTSSIVLKPMFGDKRAGC